MSATHYSRGRGEREILLHDCSVLSGCHHEAQQEFYCLDKAQCYTVPPNKPEGPTR